MRNSLSPSFLASVVVLFGCAACGKSEAPVHTAAPTPAPSSTAATGDEELGQPADPRFIGKIWVSTTPGHSRGSILIFLPDRSLLMDSCFETYRISKWGADGDRIRWVEDAIPIQATLSMLDENNLSLQITGQDRVQTYISAPVPYVCPDMPR
ncbi:MAG TPA: hypothetical protein VGE08_03480 [Steroidobacter sp.]|uniref:hypothetical protein n=1 Tax=Steroidobacter sp. TaxID=1978227 RepID=UPI002EDA6DD4